MRTLVLAGCAATQTLIWSFVAVLLWRSLDSLLPVSVSARALAMFYAAWALAAVCAALLALRSDVSRGVKLAHLAFAFLALVLMALAAASGHVRIDSSPQDLGSAWLERSAEPDHGTARRPPAQSSLLQRPR